MRSAAARGAAPRRAQSRSSIAGAKTLITPALFSQPPPRPPGEEGVVSQEETGKQDVLSPLSPGRWGGGWERGGWGSEGPPRRGALEEWRAYTRRISSKA